jgi:hypothetical protein
VSTAYTVNTGFTSGGVVVVDVFTEWGIGFELVPVPRRRLRGRGQRLRPLSQRLTKRQMTRRLMKAVRRGGGVVDPISSRTLILGRWLTDSAREDFRRGPS